MTRRFRKLNLPLCVIIFFDFIMSYEIIETDFYFAIEVHAPDAKTE